MNIILKKENLRFSVKDSCTIFYCVLAFFIICNFAVSAQNVDVSKNELKDSPVVEDNIRVVPDLLYQGIEIENKTSIEIINSKLKRIEKTKSDKKQKLSNPLHEQQRQLQLDQLKNELMQLKKNNTGLNSEGSKN